MKLESCIVLLFATCVIHSFILLYLLVLYSNLRLAVKRSTIIVSIIACNCQWGYKDALSVSCSLKSYFLPYPFYTALFQKEYFSQIIKLISFTL